MDKDTLKVLKQIKKEIKKVASGEEWSLTKEWCHDKKINLGRKDKEDVVVRKIGKIIALDYINYGLEFTGKGSDNKRHYKKL